MGYFKIEVRVKRSDGSESWEQLKRSDQWPYTWETREGAEATLRMVAAGIEHRDSYRVVEVKP